MKKNILFVDDDANVLEAFGRVFRNMREEWEMRFAASGPSALELMKTKHVDVIVSDMRMPSMNGVELLGEVKRRSPDTVRFILSGFADEGLITRSTGVAHQFLSKPCDAETLKSALGRALAIRRRVGNEFVNKIIGNMDCVPSCPALYTQVVEKIQSSESNLAQIGATIANDPGMTAKVLQLVNSAFFGLRRKITRAEDAVAYLGIDRIRALVLAASAFEKFDRRSSIESIANIWTHSINVACLAKQIVENETKDQVEIGVAFTAGLLHDLGRLVLARAAPAEYQRILLLSNGRKTPSWTVEQELLQCTHADVGANLLSLWGLPDVIVEAVAYHHQPQATNRNIFSPLTAVHAADALLAELEQNDHAPVESALNEQHLDALSLRPRLAVWRRLAAQGGG